MSGILLDPRVIAMGKTVPDLMIPANHGDTGSSSCQQIDKYIKH